MGLKNELSIVSQPQRQPQKQKQKQKQKQEACVDDWMAAMALVIQLPHNEEQATRILDFARRLVTDVVFS